MKTIDIEVVGFGKSELQELREVLRTVEGVHDADYFPDLKGKMQYRSQLHGEVPAFIVRCMVEGTESLMKGALGEAGKDTYHVVRNRIAKAVNAWKAGRISDSEDIPKRITLRGPDEAPVKTLPV